MDALDAIRCRRSTGRLVAPAPTPDEVETLLQAATSAPDHGRLRRWRFVVVEGAEKDAFADVFEAAYRRRCAEASVGPEPGMVEKERRKFTRAPMVMVVATSPIQSEKIPWVEQVLAAGAAAQNVLLAATALGYGSMWRTGDAAYDPDVKGAFGLEAQDVIVGFLYLGTAPSPEGSG